MHKAWICPRCQMVNAPWVPQCGCKPDPEEEKRKLDEALMRLHKKVTQQEPLIPYEAPIFSPVNDRAEQYQHAVQMYLHDRFIEKPLAIAKIKVKGEEDEHSEDSLSVQTEEENKSLR